MLETADLEELTVVRCLLEAEGIAHAVVDEEAVRLGPTRSLGLLFGGPEPRARVQVRASDEERARELLDTASASDEPAG
ncbi:MAG TPA: DUF2007 domain-containing protein [Thermoanaerobaculia bacterium]|nr:DUF2007 domain-containing protein [Thermoanaerobaculia bacterium]